MEVRKSLTEIIKIFKDAQTTTEFKPTIQKFQDLHQKVINTPEFKDTAILAVTSVAYYSSLFLSEVIDKNTNQPLRIPKWLT